MSSWLEAYKECLVWDSTIDRYVDPSGLKLTKGDYDLLGTNAVLSINYRGFGYIRDSQLILLSGDDTKRAVAAKLTEMAQREPAGNQSFSAPMSHEQRPVRSSINEDVYSKACSPSFILSYSLGESVVTLEKPMRNVKLLCVELCEGSGPVVYYSQLVGRDLFFYMKMVTTGLVYETSSTKITVPRNKASISLTRVVAELLRCNATGTELLQDINSFTGICFYQDYKVVRFHAGGYQLLRREASKWVPSRTADWKRLLETLQHHDQFPKVGS